MRKIRVLIQPIGEVDWSILEQLIFNLNSKSEFYEADLSKIPFEIPIESYNPLRNQYYSPLILNKMCMRLIDDPHDRILGVIDLDLYVEGLNFIFGEAQFNGKCAIISIFRLKPEFYGEPFNPQIFHERILKEAIHELGHTMGLKHCKNRKCVMHFSNSIWDTDYKDYRYCIKCKNKLYRKMRTI